MKQRIWTYSRWVLGLAIAIGCLQTVPPTAEGEASRTITLPEAAALARAQSKDLADLERTIASLERQHEDMVDLSETMSGQINSLEKFKALHEIMMERGLDELEAIQYQGLQRRFGFEPPNWEDDFLFNTFVRNRDFPHKQLQVALENAERSKAQLQAGLEMQMRSMFDQWLTLEEGLGLQRTQYDQTLRRQEETKLRLAQGTASEFEAYSADIEAQKLQLEIGKLERQRNSLELSLKSLMGLPLKDDIRLLPYGLPEEPPVLEERFVYEEKADAERTEVANARNEFENKQREWDIMSQYITDPEEFQRIEAERSLSEAKYVYETTRLDVRSEVSMAYDDAVQKRQAIASAEKQAASAEEQLRQARLSAERGMLTPLQVEQAELQLAQAKNAVSQSKREYAFAVYRLEQTCTTGPGFTRS